MKKAVLDWIINHFCILCLVALVQVKHSIIGDGCVIKAGSKVYGSVVGIRSLIGTDCIVQVRRWCRLRYAHLTFHTELECRGLVSVALHAEAVLSGLGQWFVVCSLAPGWSGRASASSMHRGIRLHAVAVHSTRGFMQELLQQVSVF